MDFIRNSGKFPILKSGLIASAIIVFGYKFVIAPIMARQRYDNQEVIAMQLYEMQQKQQQQQQPSIHASVPSSSAQK